MKKILFVFETQWDRKQLGACREAWETQYVVEFLEPNDVDCPWDFDVLSFIEQIADQQGGEIDGVVSSSDYPGATVAGAIATILRLPGSKPEEVLRCSHKYEARLIQREAVPEATPGFYLVDPQDQNACGKLTYPVFVKPVKGAFSIMSGRLDGPEDCSHFLARPSVLEFSRGFVHIFNQLVRRFTTFNADGRYFLAEDILHGSQVTVEGYCYNDEVEILGVVDSVVHPGKRSFVRFEYPSVLDRSVQLRMDEIARRVMRHFGLRNSMFNIEMIFNPESEGIHIVEINPRICGQFGDLYQKVDGINSYEILLDLAAGQRPNFRRRSGEFAVAASFPLRIFEPVRVINAPSAEEVSEMEEHFPGILIWLECSRGQELSNFEMEDGVSSRYAVVNLGAKNRSELASKLQVVTDHLGFEFENIRE